LREEYCNVVWIKNLVSDGNDNNTGLTTASPLATLEAARDVIRDMGHLPAGGVTVWIRGGRYDRTSTFSLTSADSGEATKPIAYRAYQDEEVRITFGTVLDPNWFSLCTDYDILEILPEDANGKIEVYTENASIDFRLVGYWTTAPGTYTEEFASVGKPASDNSWLDLDLTAGGAPDSSICEMLMCNGATRYENQMGVRANGSSLARILDVHEAEGSGRDCGRMHVKSDGSAVIEQRMEDVSDTGEFYLMGYWQ